MAIMKKTKNSRCWQGCGEKFHLCTVGRYVDRPNHCGKHMEDLRKTEGPNNPTILLPGIFPKKTKYEMKKIYAPLH